MEGFDIVKNMWTGWVGMDGLHKIKEGKRCTILNNSMQQYRAPNQELNCVLSIILSNMSDSIRRVSLHVGNLNSLVVSGSSTSSFNKYLAA